MTDVEPSAEAIGFAEMCECVFDYLSDYGYVGSLGEGGWCWYTYTFSAPCGFITVSYEFLGGGDFDVSFGQHPEDGWLYEIGSSPFNLVELLRVREVRGWRRLRKRCRRWNLEREPLIDALIRNANVFRSQIPEVLGGDYGVLDELRAARRQDAARQWARDCRKSRLLTSNVTLPGRFWRVGDDRVVAEERSAGVEHWGVYRKAIRIESPDTLDPAAQRLLARVGLDGFAYTSPGSNHAYPAVHLPATGAIEHDHDALRALQAHLHEDDQLVVLWRTT